MIEPDYTSNCGLYKAWVPTVETSIARYMRTYIPDQRKRCSDTSQPTGTRVSCMKLHYKLSPLSWNLKYEVTLQAVPFAAAIHGSNELRHEAG
jgi:hypothetical protein